MSYSSPSFSPQQSRCPVPASRSSLCGLILPSLFATFLFACSPDIQVSSNAGFSYDYEASSPVGRDGDSFATYVIGSTVTFTVVDGQNVENLANFKLRSDNPAVFAPVEVDCATVAGICSENYRSAGVMRQNMRALEVGTTMLEVVDGDGDVHERIPIRVSAPTRVEIHAAAPLFLARADIPSQVTSAQVLRNGTATFEARYFNGDARLLGAGALRIEAPEAAGARAKVSAFNEVRDWIEVTPKELGSHSVALKVGPFSFAPFVFEAVGEDAIASIRLEGQDESAVDDGQQLTVIGQAFAAAKTPIFGVNFAWTFNGNRFREERSAWNIDDAQEGGTEVRVHSKEVDETGDIFRYRKESGAKSKLEAKHEKLHAEVTIQGTRGFVRSSDDMQVFGR